MSGFRGYNLEMYAVILLVSHALEFIPDSTLKMYGPSDKVVQLQPRLVWATPGQRGFRSTRTAAQPTGRRTQAPAHPPTASSSSQRLPTATQLAQSKIQQESIRRAAELRDMLNTMEKVNDQSRRSSLLDTLCTNEDILSLPVYDKSPGVATGQLKVNLLKHQVRFRHVFIMTPMLNFSHSETSH